MGERKRKSRRRDEILAGEQRCVYCAGPPSTIEHMPPRSMFARSDRPSGLEFAACEPCNHSSRAADVAAAIIARISPSNAVNQLDLSEGKKLLATMAQIAPGFIVEFSDNSTARYEWLKGRDPILGRKRVMEFGGPLVTALLRTFSAKLAMALFREHVGMPLSADGMVFTRHYLNFGLHRAEAEATLSFLPDSSQLKQGRKVSGKSFNYHYSTDKKSLLSFFAAFNDNFFVRAFATCSPQIAEKLAELHEYPPVKVGGLQELSRIWEPVPIAT